MKPKRVLSALLAIVTSLSLVTPALASSISPGSGTSVVTPSTGTTPFSKLPTEWGGMVYSIYEFKSTVNFDLVKGGNSNLKLNEESVKQVYVEAATGMPIADIVSTGKAATDPCGDGMILLPSSSQTTYAVTKTGNSTSVDALNEQDVERMQSPSSQTNTAGQGWVNSWLNSVCGAYPNGTTQGFVVKYVQEHYGTPGVVVPLLSALEPSKGYGRNDLTPLNDRIEKFTDPAAQGCPTTHEKIKADSLKAAEKLILTYAMFAQVLCGYTDKSAALAMAEKADASLDSWIKGKGLQRSVIALAGTTIGRGGIDGHYNPSSNDVWWSAPQILAEKGINRATLYGTTNRQPIEDAWVKDKYQMRACNSLYGGRQGGEWHSPLTGLELASTWVHTGGADVLAGTGNAYDKGLTGFAYWADWDIMDDPIQPHIPYNEGGTEITQTVSGGVCSITIEQDQVVESKSYPVSYSDQYNITLTVNPSLTYDETTHTWSKSYMDGALTSSFDSTTHVPPAPLSDQLFALAADPAYASCTPEIMIYFKLYSNCPANGSEAQHKRNLIGYKGDGAQLARTANGAYTSTQNELGSYFNHPDSIEMSSQVAGQLVSAVNAAAGGSGVTITSAAAGGGAVGVKIKFSDLITAAKWYDVKDRTITAPFTATCRTQHDTEKQQRSIWVAIGGQSTVYVRNSGSSSGVSQHTIPFDSIYRADYVIVSPTPEERPFYYSELQKPHTEIKQGSVPMSGGGSNEQFDAMLGSPTSTVAGYGPQDAQYIDYIDYNKVFDSKGHYYYYYASGGSEFLVQFDGEYRTGETATRVFEWEFTPYNHCTETHITCPGTTAYHEHWAGDPPSLVFAGMTHDDGCCGNPPHTNEHPHIVATHATLSISYIGLSYIKIKNLQVWKLSEALVDGTYELFEVKDIHAGVQAVDTGISYNIAEANTAKQGRMIYNYLPKGEGAGGDPDHPYWVRTSNNDCHQGWQTNCDTAKPDVIGKDVGATMVSDFIVLHTSRGDQPILYYECKSDNEGEPIAEDATASGWGVSGGYPTYSSFSFSGGHVGKPVKFNNGKSFTKEQLKSGLWESISLGANAEKGCTAEILKLKPDEVTYGGYNGKYSSPSSKYQSFGGGTWSGFSGTAAYANKSGVFGQKANSALYKQHPNPVFRLLTEGLRVPDSKQNGLYEMGDSTLFYKNLVLYGDKNPAADVIPQPLFGSQVGFTMQNVGYADGSAQYDKDINDIVIYDPVSIQNAIVIGLNPDRDQRYDRTVRQGSLNLSGPGICPNDETCAFQEVDCHSTAGHLHTEACYTSYSSTLHSLPYLNTHRHTSACTYIDHPAQSGGGQWYHDSSCTYEGEIHATTSSTRCTTCGHSCGYLLSAPSDSVPAWREYTCGYPLNTHVCTPGGTAHVHTSECPSHTEYVGGGAGPGGQTGYVWYNSYHEVYLSYSGPTGYEDTYCSNHPSYYVGYYSGVTSRTVYDCGNMPYNNCEPGGLQGCYDINTVSLACHDPHHTYDWNWKVYTTGLRHQSGHICTGRSCTDTTPIQWGPDGNYVALSTIAAGTIVRHVNGVCHLTTTTNGICSYCKTSYQDVVHAATNTSRTSVKDDEWDHYPYGDPTCWKPCGDDSKHKDYVTTVKNDKGGTYSAGDFLNLDWSFVVYFPNTGDFYGTGRWGASACTAERGKGYSNGMDTTEWMSAKWVEFPFDVVYYGTSRKIALNTAQGQGEGPRCSENPDLGVIEAIDTDGNPVKANGISYNAGERIYLPVPEEYFYFYVPLENSEVAAGEIKFGASAINAKYGQLIECGMNETHNIRQIVYEGRTLSHHHNDDKRILMDLVGRIGQLTINDVGDFRYSNFFKKAVASKEWLVQNVVYKTDPSKQNWIITSNVDIRGVNIGITDENGSTINSTMLRGVSKGKPLSQADTWRGSKPERQLTDAGTQGFATFPLRPALHSGSLVNEEAKDALAKLALRVGYDAYFDITTAGNYYGSGSDNYVLVKPHYYKFGLATGTFTPVDVWVYDNDVYKLINANGITTVTDQGTVDDVNLNWTEEYTRRNFLTGTEQSKTLQVGNIGLPIPNGSTFVYGSYNLLNLMARNRSEIGGMYTYGSKGDFENNVIGMVGQDPSEKFPAVKFPLQGAKWNFNIGLPSSAKFLYSDWRNDTSKLADEYFMKTVNMDVDGNQLPGEEQCAIICCLEIYAYGDVWTLVYDGDMCNEPFKVTPSGKIFNPNTQKPTPTGGTPITCPKYPGRTEHMPLVEIISPNHSAKEDLATVGTH